MDRKRSSALDDNPRVDLQIDVTNLELTETPDGGWGWLIVASSFVLLGLVDGIALSYGLFLAALRDTFEQVSSLEMMFASSALGGIYLMMGPVSSALSNEYGFRSLVVAGAVVSTISIFLSSLMSNFTGFILTFGLFTGLGFSLCYLPGATIIAIWFRERRATATGIAFCGSSFSAALFSLLIPILIDKYTWRGCLLIISALNSHLFVVAALYRPLPLTKQPEVNLTQPMEDGRLDNVTDDMDKLIQDIARRTLMQTLNEDQNNRTALENREDDKRRSVIDMILTSKQTKNYKSTGSLNTMIITTTGDGGGAAVGPHMQQDNAVDRAKIRLVEAVVSRYFNKTTSKTASSSSGPGGRRRSSGGRATPHIRSQFNIAGSSFFLNSSPVQSALQSQTSLSYAVFSQPQLHLTSNYNLHRSVISLAPLREHRIIVDEQTVRDITGQLTREISRPLRRPDLFFQGSMQHLNAESLLHSGREARSKPNLSTLDDGLDDTDSVGSSPMRAALRQLMDLSILRSSTVQLFLALNFFCMFGFMIPYQFLISHAMFYGHSMATSASLLTTMGLASCVGRISSGFVADYRWSNCLVIHNVAILLAGLDTMLLPFFTAYPALLLFAIIYGLSTAAFISLKTIVVVDLMGAQKLTNIFGWTLLMQGFAILFGPPIISSFYDLLESYSIVFVLGGAIMSASALMGLPLTKMARREHLNDEENQ